MKPCEQAEIDDFRRKTMIQSGAWRNFKPTWPFGVICQWCGADFCEIAPCRCGRAARQREEEVQ